MPLVIDDQTLERIYREQSCLFVIPGPADALYPEVVISMDNVQRERIVTLEFLRGAAFGNTTEYLLGTYKEKNNGTPNPS